MRAAPAPPDEAQRLWLLNALEILDTPPEAGFDALTEAARQITGWPVALVSLIDEHRQWFKSHSGVDVCETPREWAFCAHALLNDEPLFEVPDASADPRFADNPLVVGPPGIRAYAGQLLVVHGVRLGTLCLIHRVPSRLTPPQRELLRALAEAASALLAERLHRSRLREATQRLADFAVASGDWLWETDAAQRLVWLSDGFELATGRRASTALGQPMEDGLLVDVRGQPLAPAVRLHELLQRGHAFSRATIAVPHPRGERWVSFSAVPLRGGDGGMRGSARDVTAYVRAEQARDAEAQCLQRLAREAPGALYEFRIDADGHASFPFVTNAFETLFGVSAQEAAASAQPVFERVHPADLPALQRSIERSRAELTTCQTTFRLRRSGGGGYRRLTYNSTPRRQPDGSVLWIGLVTDVTEQLRAHLEREYMRRQRNRAQREASARAEVLSRVSHELRTPLNAVLGFTQLMQRALAHGRLAIGANAALPAAASETSPEDWSQWVRQVHRAASHMLSIVNDVLNASSMEARRFAVELQEVDLADVARQVIDLNVSQAQAKGLRLECLGGGDGLCPAPVWVHADRRALRQVLINLVGNAIKFTPEGGHVTLRWSLCARDRIVRVEVCDDGPGISPELQAKLFSPFVRGTEVEGSTEGTGLGLTISRQLVQAMGGRLSLAAPMGKGCVFVVELPLSEPQAAGALVPNSEFGGFEPAPSDDVASSTPAALLLYVEDESVNRLLMQEFVARMPPLRLALATSLSEGLEAARRLTPDLILLDMHLPDGTGMDLLRRLRADPTTADLPVVALSADAMPGQIQKALEAGFDDYWTKPIDFVSLQQRIVRLLQRAVRRG